MLLARLSSSVKISFSWVIRLRAALIVLAVLVASLGAKLAYTHWVLKAPRTPGRLTYVLTPDEEDIHDATGRHDLKVGLDLKHVGPRSRRVGIIILCWCAFVFLADQLFSRLRLPARPEREPFVRLRAVSDADVELFFEHQREPAANRMAAFPPRERDAFFTHWKAIRDNQDVVIRTIECQGRVAGNVATFKRGELREVCYWLGREHWNKGVATEALQLFLAEYKGRPLYARVAKLNVASLRVAGKCGFAIVGEDSYKSALGENVEEYLLELRV